MLDDDTRCFKVIDTFRCQLSGEQKENLKAWVAAALPRTTRQVGAWIEKEFGLVYGSRSGLIALLHRLGLEYHKPSVIPRKLDKATTIS